VKKVQKLGRALALSLCVAAGIALFSPAVHAAPGDQSIRVRCQLLQRAIDAATANGGADSELVIYLQGLYNELCSGL
jgi:hypothetical protein